jgi:hypothetical protein
MFGPRDSTVIQDSYGHPTDGQGVYVMYHKTGKFSWCPSGNELRRVYLLDPTEWLTGPIFLPLSKEDHTRIIENFNEACENF